MAEKQKSVGAERYKPVAIVKKHAGSLKDISIIVWTGDRPPEGEILYVEKAMVNNEIEKEFHWSDCATNNHGCPELLGPCDCGYAESQNNKGLTDDDDICGLCGLPGADKIPHPIRWPGEQIPDTNLVHAKCEDEECRRAHSLLSDKQRKDFLKWC